MPVYDVTDPTQTAAWNVLNGPPPGLPAPRLVVAQAPTMANVAMGQQINVALNGQCTGIQTHHLADCSAFTVLYRPNMGAPWSQAAMIHIPGGPDPNAVNWPALVGNMPHGGIFFGILANSRPTVLSNGFVAAALAQTPIPPGNLWVYNGQSPAIGWGVDWNGFTGEV